MRDARLQGAPRHSVFGYNQVIHVGRDVLAYQVVKQILSVCAEPQPL